MEIFNAYADYFAIDSQLEIKHFVAQFAHECDQWNAYEEYARGDAKFGTLAAFIYWTSKDLNALRQPDGSLVTIKRYNGRKNNYKKLAAIHQKQRD